MMRKILTRGVVPLLVVAGGVAGAWFLFAVAPEAAEPDVAARAVPVDVHVAARGEARVVVTATGLVVPAKVMTVSPEVAGRIVQRAAGLVPGGRLREGELIARIDARDYELALRQERSRIVAAELDLRTERARSDVARREWELLAADRTGEAAELALRQPHLAARRASLEAAESGVQRAKLALSRTTIRTPWNAVVAEATVEEGQVVAPGTKIARLIGADQMWVRVSVALGDLAALAIPGVGPDTSSPARVIHDLGSGQRVVRDGRVLRLESEIDAQTRTAQLLVAVDAPLDEPAGAVPLLPGSYVTVELQGRPLPGVFTVPREALRGGDTLWIVDAASRLARRTVEVRGGDDRVVFVTGLADGDRVVTTNLSLPIAGAAVTVRAGAAANEAPAAAPRAGPPAPRASPPAPSAPPAAPRPASAAEASDG